MHHSTLLNEQESCNFNSTWRGQILFNALWNGVWSKNPQEFRSELFQSSNPVSGYRRWLKDPIRLPMSLWSLFAVPLLNSLKQIHNLVICHLVPRNSQPESHKTSLHTCTLLEEKVHSSHQCQIHAFIILGGPGPTPKHWGQWLGFSVPDSTSVTGISFIIFLSPCESWGNKGSERLSHLPETHS